MERDFYMYLTGWFSYALKIFNIEFHKVAFIQLFLECLKRCTLFWVYHFTQVAHDDKWHLKAPLTLINLKSNFILYVSKAETLQRVCVQRVEIRSQASVHHFLSLLILIQNVFPERKNKRSQVKKKILDSVQIRERIIGNILQFEISHLTLKLDWFQNVSL